MIHPKFQDGVFLGKASSAGSWKVGKVLRIGKIINHNGESVESLVLEPQGIAHLISKECVELPDDECALAHVLTRMCNNGLLTLNIGVVDPSWKNHLSSPVLNFSSEKRLLEVGQPFIRLTFHHVDLAAGAEKEKRKEPWDEATYVGDVRARAVGNFGRSFLNIEQLVGEASKKEAARLRQAMLKYIPIGAFSLAFFALLVTVGVATLARHATSDSSVSESEREWRGAIMEQQKIIADRLAQLEQSQKSTNSGADRAQGSSVATPATHRADNAGTKATKPGGAE